MFSISFLPDQPSDDEDEPDGWYGEIRIGKFNERFLSCLSFWSKEQYKAQWKQAITRIIRGEHVSALITGMYDPTKANHIIWWPMYREGRIVYIQNQLLFMHQIKGIFNIENPYEYIDTREVSTEDGASISEWSIDIHNLEEFMQGKS